MTPKEKAINLFNKHYLLILEIDNDLSQEIIISILAKKNALLTVDEIIASLGRLNVEILHIGIDFSNLITELRSNYNSHVIYWNEVKNEIEKL